MSARSYSNALSAASSNDQVINQFISSKAQDARDKFQEMLTDKTEQGRALLELGGAALGAPAVAKKVYQAGKIIKDVIKGKKGKQGKKGKKSDDDEKKRNDEGEDDEEGDDEYVSPNEASGGEFEMTEPGEWQGSAQLEQGLGNVERAPVASAQRSVLDADPEESGSTAFAGDEKISVTDDLKPALRNIGRDDIADDIADEGEVGAKNINRAYNALSENPSQEAQHLGS